MIQTAQHGCDNAIRNDANPHAFECMFSGECVNKRHGFCSVTPALLPYNTKKILDYLNDLLELTDDTGTIRNLCTTPRCVVLNLKQRIERGDFDTPEGTVLDNLIKLCTPEDNFLDRDAKFKGDCIHPSGRLLKKIKELLEQTEE
jgi:hypothetical protein